MPTKTKHAHHWLVDSPNGPTSKATCKTCGAADEFMNSIPIERYSAWQGKSQKGQKSATVAAANKRNARRVK